jgi:uncharacterized protein
MTVWQKFSVESLPRVPWRNGAGTTRNLGVFPASAGFDDFLWRVSLAEVSASGSFSLFPGVDRTILVWEGNGMTLRVGDGAEFGLTALFEPHALRGETEIEATLVDGPTIDLNVMIRRGRAVAATARYESETLLARNADEAFFLCPRGAFRIVDPSGLEHMLSTGEVVRISNLETGIQLIPAETGAVVIGIFIDVLR